LTQTGGDRGLDPRGRSAAAPGPVNRRSGLPIIRPLCLTDPEDPRGWSVSDAYGYGPSLWVAPVLDEGAREREVALPRGDWIETWSGELVRGGRDVIVTAPLERIPGWVRAGSIIVTYPAADVTTGLGDRPDSDRPVVATPWGMPPSGGTAARLADRTVIAWRRGRWLVAGDQAQRDIELVHR
jgi:hypothetical protein